MARNFNGFILANDVKKPSGARKVTISQKGTPINKPKSLLQENLSLVKAETKKIYTTKVSTQKKPLKAGNSIKFDKSSVAVKSLITKADIEIEPKPSTSDSKTVHVRSGSRTLEPHEIVLLKNPPDTSEPGVHIISKNKTNASKSSEDSNSSKSSDNSYGSDFDSYESDFEEEDDTDSTKSSESESKKSKTPEDDDVDTTDHSEDFTTAIEIKPREIIKPAKLVQKSYFYDRGYEIMKKITFDIMHYDLYEAKPISYQVYMKLYGKSYYMQNCSQTDSFSTDAETQVEYNQKSSVWTQFPTTINKNLQLLDSEREKKSTTEKTDYHQWMNISIKNTVNLATNYKINQDSTIDMDKLNAFLVKTLTSLSLIFEKNSKNYNLKASNAPISNGYVEIDVKNLERSSIVSLIYANPDIPNTLLTVHSSKTYDNFTQECLVCIWNTAFSEPIKILSCWNWISCILIVPDMKTVVIGGGKDGVLICWDTLERVQWNRAFPLHFHNAPSLVITSTDEKGASYNGSLIALRMIKKNGNTIPETNQAYKICTLHEEAVITIWALMYLQASGNESFIKAKVDNSATWTKLKLIQTYVIPISLTQKYTNTTENEYDKTLKYFESNIYNDKVLQQLSISDKKQKTNQLIAVNENMSDLLIIDDQFVILTNKNYIYICSMIENSTSKKVIIATDDSIFGTSMCECKQNNVAIFLCNGTMLILNIAQNQEPVTEYLHLTETLFFQDASRFQYFKTGCDFKFEKLYVYLNNQLNIYNFSNRQGYLMETPENIKAIQVIPGPISENKLVRLDEIPISSYLI